MMQASTTVLAALFAAIAVGPGHQPGRLASPHGSPCVADRAEVSPQDPEVRKVQGVAVVLADKQMAGFADRVAQVISACGTGLDQLGLALPKGARILLEHRADYETAAAALGIDVTKNLKATTYAYSASSDWVPVIHVLAEQTDEEQVADQLSDYIADALGSLVAYTQTHDSPPFITGYGLGGYLCACYQASSQRNHGTAIAVAAVPQVQEKVLFITNQQPRRPAREILVTAPTDQGVRDHTTMFFNVLLFGMPAARHRAVGKVLMGWARGLTRTLDDKQVLRMETDLVEALGIKGSVIKDMGLVERMTALGIDKKQQKDPGALLRACYDVQLDRLAAACEASKAKPSAGEPDKGK